MDGHLDGASDAVFFPKGAIIAAVMIPVVLFLGIWLLLDFIRYHRRKTRAWNEKIRELHFNDLSEDIVVQNDYDNNRYINPRKHVLSCAGKDNLYMALHAATIHSPETYSELEQYGSLGTPINLRGDIGNEPSSAAHEGQMALNLNDKMTTVPSRVDVRVHTKPQISNDDLMASETPSEFEMLSVKSLLKRQNTLPHLKRSILVTRSTRVQSFA